MISAVNISKAEEGSEVIENAKVVLLKIINAYANIIMNDHDSLNKQERRKPTIESLSEEFCDLNLRFKKDQLVSVYNQLRFLEVITFNDRSKMSGEELFIRGLYELTTGQRKSDIAKLFGGDQPLQSRAFNYFIEFIQENFSHLLNDNLEWFYKNGLVADSANLIGAKINQQHDNVFAFFIDCNCLESDRPGKILYLIKFTCIELYYYFYIFIISYLLLLLLRWRTC
jgi:hypothetical protein